MEEVLKEAALVCVHVCVHTILSDTHVQSVLSPRVELKRCTVSSNG